MGKSKRKLKKRLKQQRNRGKAKQVNGTNKHHLTPKSRGGLARPYNLLRIDIQKHQCWHKIFKNLTLEEVIAELQRLKRMKRRGGV